VLASASPAQFKSLSSSARKLAIRPPSAYIAVSISHGGQICPRRLTVNLQMPRHCGPRPIPMRYRVTGFDSSGSNLFSRVVEAMDPDHAKIAVLVELRRSFADAHLADKAERLEVEADR
jgi:hypothetical protein